MKSSMVGPAALVVGALALASTQHLPGVSVPRHEAAHVLGTSCEEYDNGSVTVCSDTCGTGTRQKFKSGSAKRDPAVPCDTSSQCTIPKTLSGTCVKP